MPAAERQAAKNARESGAHGHRTIHQGGVSDIDACTQGIPATRLMASGTPLRKIKWSCGGVHISKGLYEEPPLACAIERQPLSQVAKSQQLVRNQSI